MILETLRAALAMIAILRVLQQGPRSLHQLSVDLASAGIFLEARTLQGLLRRLAREGYLAPALHLEPGNGGERRYWTTRRGTLASDGLQGAVQALGRPGEKPLRS